MRKRKKSGKENFDGFQLVIFERKVQYELLE